MSTRQQLFQNIKTGKTTLEELPQLSIPENYVQIQKLSKRKTHLLNYFKMLLK